MPNVDPLHAMLPNVALRPDFGPEAESVLSAILSASDYGVLLTDLEHRAMACNRRFGELFNVEPAEVVRSDVEEVREMVKRRIGDLDHWLANLDEVYANPNHAQEDELELLNPRIVIRRFTGPVHGPDGELIGRLWTFLDITQEHNKNRISETLHQIALFHDEDPGSVYRFATEKVGEFYGSISLLSILDGDFLHFRAVGGPPSPAREMAGNTLSDSFCQFCLTNQGPLIVQDARLDGRMKDLLPVRLGLTRYAGVPLHAPGGHAIGTLCILDGRSDEILDAHDERFLSLAAMKISAELEREKQLRSLKEDLSVTSATLEKTQRQLIESEKLAVTGTLAASIAHDIRNILSSISLEIEIGAADPAPTLQSVKEQLDRFNLLAHRLLSYARPRSTKHETLDLKNSIDRVLSLVSAQAKQQGVEFKVDWPKDSPTLHGEASQLDHLFANLALNALQAMQRGGKLTISGKKRGQAFEIAFKDTGPGVAPAIAERLFEPFASTRPDGFGLGLFSCRRIAEDHGGSIGLQTAPGQGSTFTVRLPLL